MHANVRGSKHVQLIPINGRATALNINKHTLTHIVVTINY